MNDVIYRHDAIDAVDAIGHIATMSDGDKCIRRSAVKYTLSMLPSAQPEPSIPLSWIEEHIKWLKSLDNEFANLAAIHISVMVKKWRSEQDE